MAPNIFDFHLSGGSKNLPLLVLFPKSISNLACFAWAWKRCYSQRFFSENIFQRKVVTVLKFVTKSDESIRQCRRYQGRGRPTLEVSHRQKFWKRWETGHSGNKVGLLFCVSKCLRSAFVRHLSTYSTVYRTLIVRPGFFLT